MQHSLNRIWAVANTVTGDVLYSSCQYTQAKNLYDFYRRNSSVVPLSLLRYDLSRSYWDELNRIIEDDMQQALSNLVSLAHRSPTTTNNTNTKTQKKEN